ncbi:MAG: hypothetical protein CVV44_03510 [Spirochaetae bacterium HGW-Spirochaetae-1]|jgi:DNA-binding NtrC family response regulator|nr:MAG: hypothetical protein CVV44_03510 [Spirochaetae bacterium HGW-Spirochaetae-1]
MNTAEALLIDDDGTTGEILRRISGEVSLYLNEFNCTDAAAKYVDEKTVDMAFIDLMMILSDDYCLFRKLRSYRPFMKVFILVSVASNKTLNFSQFEDEYTFLLEKPLEYTTTLNKIKKAMESRDRC